MCSVMDTGQNRLLQFDRDLLSGKNICSSRGIFVTFPSSLKKTLSNERVGAGYLPARLF